MSEPDFSDPMDGLPTGIKRRIAEQAEFEGVPVTLEFVAAGHCNFSRERTLTLIGWLHTKGLEYRGDVPRDKETTMQKDLRLHCEQILWAAFAETPSHNVQKCVLKLHNLKHQKSDAKERALAALKRAIALIEQNA